MRRIRPRIVAGTFLCVDDALVTPRESRAREALGRHRIVGDDTGNQQRLGQAGLQRREALRGRTLEEASTVQVKTIEEERREGQLGP